jgi:hypothetical protein
VKLCPGQPYQEMQPDIYIVSSSLPNKKADVSTNRCPHTGSVEADPGGHPGGEAVPVHATQYLLCGGNPSTNACSEH